VTARRASTDREKMFGSVGREKYLWMRNEWA
jgi:hypothetical protein